MIAPSPCGWMIFIERKREREEQLIAHMKSTLTSSSVLTGRNEKKRLIVTEHLHR